MFGCLHCAGISADVSLADFAYEFSPLVEETTSDTVVIDVEGCEFLFGSAYELANTVANRASRSRGSGGLGCKLNVAIAANPDAAIHAAQFFEGITFISSGEELTGLGDLPLEALCPQLCQTPNVQHPLPKTRSKIKSSTPGIQTLDLEPGTLDQNPQAILETLKLWGVRTFRDFAALPTTGVAERLGQEGVRLQQLASGKTERHLKLKIPAPVFENSIELEYPISELERLSFNFARSLNQLCASLNAYALATNELRVEMKLEDETVHVRTLNLPYPMRDHKVFLKLLLLDTETHPPSAAVTAFSICCEPVKPRVLQNGLFIPLAPEPEKLELTLARLAKLVGEENIGSAALLNTHRRDAFQMKRFVINVPQSKKRSGRIPVSPSPGLPVADALPLIGFRTFRPPLRAMVQADKGYPTQISAWSKDKSVYGKVVRLAGPWRSTGDWWRGDAWARDEWDVAVESSAGSTRPAEFLYRIYRELNSGNWFVEGLYD